MGFFAKLFGWEKDEKKPIPKKKPVPADAEEYREIMDHIDYQEKLGKNNEAATIRLQLNSEAYSDH